MSGEKTTMEDPLSQDRSVKDKVLETGASAAQVRTCPDKTMEYVELK